ncbi:MAG TPA: acyl-CoA dehydrogenase family protein [Streptosporangiaceae bacterium]|nr:acyl-CoA dehydrogenase family protein [Streptosporangiaceae bacterium]
MDFSVTQAHEELSVLTRRILADRATTERLAELDRAGEGFDPQLWADLAAAGVLSAALPESAGGDGYGLAEQCGILTEVGRAVAPAPYLESIAAGAAVVARFGTDEQVGRWAAPAGAGYLVIAPAQAEPGTGDPRNPSTRAEATPGGWRLDGRKTAVPAGASAGLLLVSAATAAGPALFCVEPADPGVSVRRQRLVDSPGAAELDLDSVSLGADRLLGAPGSAPGSVPEPGATGWLVDRTTVGLCALQLGVTERALELTAEYARTRKQFGRPIGAFQAVAQRLADAYIDVEAIRLTMWQAAWRLEAGLPCEQEIATAKFWAADGGHRVAHTAVHIHGGVGIDTSYPLHRYFRAAKRNEFALGGATAQLRRLGDALAVTTGAG